MSILETEGSRQVIIDCHVIENTPSQDILNVCRVRRHYFVTPTFLREELSFGSNISVKTVHKTIRYAALATKEIHKTIENIILSSMAQATIFNEIFVIGEDFISQTIIGFFNGNDLLYR
jgi:hypothetical protein